jgi:hypothetical protein
MSDVVIHGKEQKLNRLKREEVVPTYIYDSLPFYQEKHEDEELEKKAQIFEPKIFYVVGQKVATQGKKMSRGV